MWIWIIYIYICVKLRFRVKPPSLAWTRSTLAAIWVSLPRATPDLIAFRNIYTDLWSLALWFYQCISLSLLVCSLWRPGAQKLPGDCNTQNFPIWFLLHFLNWLRPGICIWTSLCTSLCLTLRSGLHIGPLPLDPCVPRRVRALHGFFGKFCLCDLRLLVWVWVRLLEHCRRDLLQPRLWLREEGPCDVQEPQPEDSGTYTKLGWFIWTPPNCARFWPPWRAIIQGISISLRP